MHAQKCCFCVHIIFDTLQISFAFNESAITDADGDEIDVRNDDDFKRMTHSAVTALYAVVDDRDFDIHF